MPMELLFYGKYVRLCIQIHTQRSTKYVFRACTSVSQQPVAYKLMTNAWQNDCAQKRKINGRRRKKWNEKDQYWRTRRLFTVYFPFLFFSFSISQLFCYIYSIPAPHIVAARAYHMANSPSGSQSNASLAAPGNATQEKTPLYRLAKLLNQSIKTSDQNIVVKDDAPRRLSWER